MAAANALHAFEHINATLVLTSKQSCWAYSEVPWNNLLYKVCLHNTVLHESVLQPSPFMAGKHCKHQTAPAGTNKSTDLPAWRLSVNRPSSYPSRCVCVCVRACVRVSVG